MDSTSIPQLALISSLVSILFMLAGLAAVVFGVIKTTGLPRTLLMVAGGVMLLSRLLLFVLPVLFAALGPVAQLIGPSLVLGLFGVVEVVCLVLAAVKAGEQRAQARLASSEPGEFPSYGPPGQGPSAYGQQQYPRQDHR